MNPKSTGFLSLRTRSRPSSTTEMWVCVMSTGPPPRALHSGAWRSRLTISSHSARPSSRWASTSGPRIEEGRETTARGDHLAVPPGEPGADPVRALEEGERRPPVTADAPADHEAAGINEAHVLEHAAGRGHSDGEGTERCHRGRGGGDAPEAEGMRPIEEGRRQGAQHAHEGETGENRVVHHGERSRRIVETGELGGERCGGGADETIAAAPILLPRKTKLAPARKPARARVERSHHALPGGADAEREIERRVVTLRDDAFHLIGEAQDGHALAIPAHEVEERTRESGGLRGGAEALGHLGAQVVVDVEKARGGLRVGAVPHQAGAASARAKYWSGSTCQAASRSPASSSMGSAEERVNL